MQHDWWGGCQRQAGTNSWRLKLGWPKGGRKVAGLGIYLEAEPWDLLTDWMLTRGAWGHLGNKTKCMITSTIIITAFYNKWAWFSLHLHPSQNSATRAVPPPDHMPLEPNDNLKSLSYRAFVRPSEEEEGWGCRGRRCGDQAAARSHLLRRHQQEQGLCFRTVRRCSQGRKNCSVISYKRIFVWTAFYEETCFKTKNRNINIWYLEAFFFLSIPLFFLLEAQKK